MVLGASALESATEVIGAKYRLHGLNDLERLDLDVTAITSYMIFFYSEHIYLYTLDCPWLINQCLKGWWFSCNCMHWPEAM